MHAVAALVLATTLGCGSSRGDEALAMFDVVADTPVPAFTTFCFSVVTRPNVRTHHLVAPTSRRMKFGYYLPGPAGQVQVRGQALTASGEVVGEGLADVDIQLGHTSDVIPLVVGGHEFTRNWCTTGGGVADADVDASPDGGAEDGPEDSGIDDGAEDATDGAHEPPDAGEDTTAEADATLDTASDASPDGGTDGPADGRVDTAPDVMPDAPAPADAAPDVPAPADVAPDTSVRPDVALDTSVDLVPIDSAPVDRPAPCTGCTVGEKRTETGTCGPCGTGKHSRTLTCSATCTWTGDWGACTDPGTAANGCSVVDWCTRKAAPECKQKACTTAQALAECKAEAKTVCGSNSPAPTITYCN